MASAVIQDQLMDEAGLEYLLGLSRDSAVRLSLVELKNYKVTRQIQIMKNAQADNQDEINWLRVFIADETAAAPARAAETKKLQDQLDELNRTHVSWIDWLSDCFWGLVRMMGK